MAERTPVLALWDLGKEEAANFVRVPAETRPSHHRDGGTLPDSMTDGILFFRTSSSFHDSRNGTFNDQRNFSVPHCH